MKIQVVVSFLFAITMAKSEIYEPSMEDTLTSENDIPSPLFVSRPRSMSYGPAETISTPENDVPDVIMYLSSNSPPIQPIQQYRTGNPVSNQQYLTSSSILNQQYLTERSVPNQLYHQFSTFPRNHQYLRRY